MPASSSRRRRSASMLVGMPSGDAASSPYVRLPWRMSRTIRSDHLSPTMSSVPATGHGERAPPLDFFAFAFIDFAPFMAVTCKLQVYYATVPSHLQSASCYTRDTVMNEALLHGPIAPRLIRLALPIL